MPPRPAIPGSAIRPELLQHAFAWAKGQRVETTARRFAYQVVCIELRRPHLRRQVRPPTGPAGGLGPGIPWEAPAWRCLAAEHTEHTEHTETATDNYNCNCQNSNRTEFSDLTDTATANCGHHNNLGTTPPLRSGRRATHPDGAAVSPQSVAVAVQIRPIGSIVVPAVAVAVSVCGFCVVGVLGGTLSARQTSQARYGAWNAYPLPSWTARPQAFTASCSKISSHACSAAVRSRRRLVSSVTSGSTS